VRICLMIEGQEGVAWADWVALAEACERRGFDALFRSDHYLSVEGRGERGSLDAWATISALSAITERLRFGTLVSPATFRHPSVLAKIVATLDLLSGGRVELGLGAGWQLADYNLLGLQYDSAGTRIAGLEEAIAVVKGCFADGSFSFEGDHYRITNYDAQPAPVQRPHPPLIVGGGGRKLLRLAGREADIVGINPNLREGVVGADAVLSTLREVTDQKVQWIRDGAGERFMVGVLQIRYFVASITDDAMGLAEALAPAFNVDPGEALQSSVACVGTVDQVCELLEQRREEWGVSYAVFGEDTFEAFAPVVARLAGT